MTSGDIQGTRQDLLGEVAALSKFMGKIIHERTCAELDGVSGVGVDNSNFLIKLHGKIIVNIGRLDRTPAPYPKTKSFLGPLITLAWEKFLDSHMASTFKALE